MSARDRRAWPQHSAPATEGAAMPTSVEISLGDPQVPQAPVAYYPQSYLAPVAGGRNDLILGLLIGVVLVTFVYIVMRK